ncbi:MAG: GGDEF domain-containing protein [Cloacibacillus sp.]
MPHISRAGNFTMEAMTEIAAANTLYENDRDSYEQFFNVERMKGLYAQNKRTDMLEFRYYAKDGSVRWARAVIDLLQYPYSTDIKCYLLIEDVHEGRIANITLLERSTRDSLTSVLNRRAFEDSVKELLEGDALGDGAVVMMLDVDGFKYVNDSMGHAVGDDVLIHVAESISSLMRPGEMVGRMGGDEFMICLRGASRAEAAARADMIGRLARLYEKESVNVSVSIGLAMYPDDARNFEDIYRCADRALYAAKKEGKDRHMFYDACMEENGVAAQVGEGSALFDKKAHVPQFQALREKILEASRRAADDGRDLSKLNSLMLRMRTSVFEWNAEEGLVQCSGALYDYLLFDEGRIDKVVQNPAIDALHPDDAELYKKNVTYSFFYGAQNLRTVCRLKRHDGVYAQCRFNIFCERNKQGGLLRVSGMLQELGREFRVQDLYPEMVVNNMIAGSVVLEVSDKMQFVYATPSFYKVTGIQEDVSLACDFENTLMKVLPDDR